LAASAGIGGGGGGSGLIDLKHDLHEEVVPAMPGAEHTDRIFHLARPQELWLLQQGLEDIIVSLT
jgi:hypothetical protein